MDNKQKSFIRKYCNFYLGFQILPDDILLLLQLFCQNGLVWTFCGKDLQQFLESQKGEKFHSPPFVQNNISFECVLCKNPTFDMNVGYVQFSLKIREWDPQISAISVCYELKCLQTKSHWIKSVQFASIWDSTSWDNRMLNNLTFNTMELKRLDFLCSVDVINVKYTEQYRYKNYKNYILMETNCKYNWTVDKVLSEQFINCKHKRKLFFSKKFNNDCFCIAVVPKFNADTMLFQIGIKILKLPLCVEKIETKITVKVSKSKSNSNYLFGNDLFKKSEKVTFSHVYSDSTFYFDAFNGEESVRNALGSMEMISAEISILGVWDNEFAKVERKQWNKYGIISMMKALFR